MKTEEILESEKQYKLSKKYFFEAKSLQLENKLIDAEKKYHKSMSATNVDGIFYHLSNGKLCITADKIEDALTEFMIAKNIDDQNVEVHLCIGNVYRKLTGKYRAYAMFDQADSSLSQSIKSLERAMELAPDYVDVQEAITLTYLMFTDNNRKKAKEYAKKVLALDTDSYYGLLNMARILREKNKIKESKELMQKAVLLKPNLPGAYSFLGSRKFRNQNPLEPKPMIALEWLEKADELNPNNNQILTEIAKVYLEIHQPEKAVKYFDRIVKSKSGSQNYGALANRGNALLRCNRPKEAEKDLKKSLSIRGDFTFALVAMRNLTKKLGRYEESLEYANIICETQSHYKNTKEQKEIEELFNKNKRESLQITRNLQRRRLDFKNKKMVGDLKRALDLFSGNYDAMGILGMYYRYKKDLKNAHKFLNNALTINPNSRYRSYFASVLELSGDYKLAKKEYKLVLKRDHKNKFAIDGIKKIDQKLKKTEQKKKFDLFKGPNIKFLNTKTGREEIHSIEIIRNFLNDRMNDWKLPIREIITDVGKEPVFIIAKTGVGKTVTVPTKVWLELCDKLIADGDTFRKSFPQVYVIEPRIPICTMTMIEMNDGYQSYLAYQMVKYDPFRKYLKKRGIRNIDSKDGKTVSVVIKLAYEFVNTGKAPYDPKYFNLYGCITSATGKVNADAPILFVTTGIMESLTFDGSKLDSRYNRIIIDEAHVTIEQNPAIELGIALAKKRGVAIDYMSATVDKATLSEDLEVNIKYAGTQRFPIYLTNLGGSIEEHLLDIVENFLIEPDPQRFPDPDNFSDETVKQGMIRIREHLLSKEDIEEDGKTYAGLKNRAQGLLVIVNSHQSENSDTKRFADIISKAAFQSSTKVHTLRLASPVVRNPQQKLAFDRMIHKIEKEKGKYVIIATNVVEMGLTFSSLDYVITMDSEFDNEFVDGGQMIRKVELGVNALYQRIGRCGRVRPGIAFIAKDYGASYTEKSDEELSLGLQEAPIKYPLAKGNFQKLALYSFREGIPSDQLRDEIENLKLPSKIEADDELWDKFLAERKRLIQIGVASGDRLTDAGQKALTFIGVDDMYFSKLLAESVKKYGLESNVTLFFAFVAASTEVGFSSIVMKDFVLENPMMLSVSEIIDGETLDVELEVVERIILDNAGDVDNVSIELLNLNISNIVIDRICYLSQEGYNLKQSRDDNNSKEEDENSFVEQLEIDNLKVLSFEKTLIPLNCDSELINSWRIYNLFFNKYYSHLRMNKFSNIESIEFKQKLEKKLSKMQLSFRSLNTLNSRFFDICKHLKIKLPKVEKKIDNDIELSREDKDVLLESCIRELLYERVGNNDDYNFCLQLFKLTQKSNRPNFGALKHKLKSLGFETNEKDIKKWWFLIIREANKKMKEYLDIFIEKREVLPNLTDQEEKQVMKLLHKTGYHKKLFLEKSKFGYIAKYEDPENQEFEMYFDSDNSPLQVGLREKDCVEVYAKLTPVLVADDEGKDDSEEKSLEKKSYKISHVTLLPD